jgi:hypothetical protein
MQATQLTPFARSYIETALWSSTDEDGTPLDRDHSIEDIAPDTRTAMVEDCADFEATFVPFITGREAQAGHDFWLTRNGHGAGFWDGDWSDPYAPPADDDDNWHAAEGAYPTVGDYLTAMSKPYGSYGLYVGDDNLIHSM